MAQALYLYVPLDVRLVEEIIDSHSRSFEEELKDLFSEDELESFHEKLETMALYSVNLKPQEITFDDFETDLSDPAKRALFDSSRALVVLDNIPFLESNAFQVSTLRSFLDRLPEVLVDETGLGRLLSKKEYLEKIAHLRGIDTYIQTQKPPQRQESSSSVPVEPIDFLVRDTYQQMERIVSEKLLEKTLIALRTEKDSVKDLFFLVRESRPEPTELFRRSGLKSKAFGDDLERLMIFLRSQGASR